MALLGAALLCAALLAAAAGLGCRAASPEYVGQRIDTGGDAVRSDIVPNTPENQVRWVRAQAKDVAPYLYLLR
jgi:hypothetical protein